MKLMFCSRQYGMCRMSHVAMNIFYLFQRKSDYCITYRNLEHPIGYFSTFSLITHIRLTYLSLTQYSVKNVLSNPSGSFQPIRTNTQLKYSIFTCIHLSFYNSRRVNREQWHSWFHEQYPQRKLAMDCGINKCALWNDGKVQLPLMDICWALF